MKANNLLFQMRRYMLLPLVLLVTLVAFGQKTSVSGTVTDGASEPIIGASVTLQGTSVGAVTDLDGHFTIQVEPGAMLTFSYMGFKTVKAKAAQGMTVVLTEDVNLLEEVVTIGYGSVRRKDVTTAVSSVSTEDLDTRPIVSAAQGMQGKAAGL